MEVKLEPTIGDIFFGEEEFVLGKYKSNKKIVMIGIKKTENIKEKYSEETIHSKGFTFIIPKTIKMDMSCHDDSRIKAVWVVEHVEFRDDLRLIHSTLPKSFMVVARRLKDGLYDEDGEVIEFFTYGSYENTIHKGIEVIGKLENYENKIRNKR